MATVLEPAMAKPSFLLPEAAEKPAPESRIPQELSNESNTNKGSSLDGLFIWICVNCGFLFFGMHLYELIVWIRQ
jgi:hypothetical protein